MSPGGGIGVWSSRAEQIVSRLLAGLPKELADTDSVRLAALPIGYSLWAGHYLRPNGEVVVVGADWNHPDEDTVRSEPGTVLQVLVWGAQRYPELRELLPVRPPRAVDCLCRDIPILAEGKAICPVCNGLGWVSTQDTV